MKTGGSNYIAVNGLISETPVIGRYHEHVDEVTTALREMYEHGQRQITLVCWYAPVNFPAARDHVWRHVLDCTGGVMFQQHKNNLTALLGLIRQCGFTELHFRFGAQGNAQPSTWLEWNPAQFDENWHFINDARNHVDANRAGLKVVFDLGVEQANERLDTDAIHLLFCRRLWRLYTDAHGPADSCGFTILHGNGGTEAMIRRFRQAGLPLPATYGYDAYGFEYQALTTGAAALRAANEIAKPVYLQETFYNDSQVLVDVKRALADAPDLNFTGIFQWPQVRNTPGGDGVPDIYPKRFDNYLVEG